MGYKTENWQDIEVGDVISIGENWVGVRHDEESVVERVYWSDVDSKCLGVSSKIETSISYDGLWSVEVGDDTFDQVRLTRKHNANS